MTRILVVDDSAVIRQRICDYIADAPGLEVAGQARDGQQALQMLEVVRPDVITLDIQMPKMDGLATLDAILQRRPTPVIMVSSLTQLGASTTLDALERGALDYVAKPETGAGVEAALGDELLRKIRSAAGAKVERILEIRRERNRRRAKQAPKRRATKTVSSASPRELADKCIAIGVSTGGPPALCGLFETLAPPMPPIVVVQHMPAQFTRSLAWRLDSLSKLSVKEASAGDALRPNHVLLAPGGKHLSLRRQGKWVKATINSRPPVSGHRPSVDVMMNSVAAIFPNRCLGVIMTGMGRDGSDGCAAIRAAGGYVLGQNEQTSAVYGMNKVAHTEGNVDRQFALADAAIEIRRHIHRAWRPRTALAV